jgi:hypothetical protein
VKVMRVNVEWPTRQSDCLISVFLPDDGLLFPNFVKEGLPTNRELIGLVNSSAFTRIYTVVPAQNILNERVVLKTTMESEKWSRWLRCS